MFLYKQMVDEQGSVGSLELLMKSESLDELKAEAVRIAADLGCLHISWLWGKDSNPPMEFPLEFEVNETCQFLIRQW